MMIAPVFAAFEEKVVGTRFEPAKAADVKEALNEAWERYNHGSGNSDLAEKNNTRSLSVGDVVLVAAYPKNSEKSAAKMFAWTRYFVVEAAGFQEVTYDGHRTWLYSVPQRDRSFGVKDCGYKIETPPIVPEAGMGATMQIGSDSDAYTISRVSKTGKTFWMKRDIATRTDDNGISENQKHSYKSDPDASETRVTRRKDGRWRVTGYETTGSVGLDFRRTYRDPSF